MGTVPGLHAGRRRPRRRGRPRRLRGLVARRRASERAEAPGGDRRRAERAQRGDRGDDRPGAGDAAEAEPDDPGRARRPATSRPMPQLMEEINWEEEIGNSRVLREPIGVLGAITPWNYPLNQIARQGRPRPRRRLHRRPQAERGDAAERLPAGRGDRGRRAARRRLQPRHRHRPGGRRGDRRPPRRRHGLLHRLDPGRQTGLRAGLGDGQAGGDGARRQVAQRDPRRRRPRPGGPRRGRQVLPQLRPDLQRPDPDAGAARARSPRPRSSRWRRPRPSPPATRSTTRPGSARSSPPSSASASAATSRRARPRARKLLTGGAEAPEGLDRGYFVRPTVFSEVDAGDDDRPRGDLRPGAGDPALRGRGRRGADRQRQRLRPRRRRLVRRPGARDRASPGGSAAGQIEINGGAFNPLAPFGGYGQSGHGRENGRYGLEELLQVKSLQL